MNRKGQTAIFIIVAIVILSLVSIFIFRDKMPSGAEGEFSQVYEQYSSCIEGEARAAISLAGSQGGRIEAGEFKPGSDYAPFSTHLNFLGTFVPYWFYVSGNGLIKENVPKKSEMEGEIAKFIEQGISECDFDALYLQGFDVDFGTPKAEVKIYNSRIDIDVNARILASKDGASSNKESHSVSFDSNYGAMYQEAYDIYKLERESVFLEMYAEDVLRLYAPVDGVDLSCSPKIWKTQEVKEELLDALEANIGSIKMSGDYYSINKDKEYFVVDKEVNYPVSFQYSKRWPTRIEIYGASDELMVANPIGNQPGLGVMGFCYSPYHFVYDISFPVMVQLYEDGEIFQFPIVVVIDKNVPIKANLTVLFEEQDVSDPCSFNTKDIIVNTWSFFGGDMDLIDARVSYSCFDKTCELGESVDGILNAKVPACYQGQLTARAEGFEDANQIFSSNSQNLADIVLEKNYDVKIEVEAGGKLMGPSDRAVVTFDGPIVRSIVLPEQDKVKLIPGEYNISVYVYGDSSITIPSSTKEQCVEVSQKGLIGMFGGTKEQCFDIDYPETKIEQAMVAGGVGGNYILTSDLEKGIIRLRVDRFENPNSLEQLQFNLESVENNYVEVIV
jgi:hypothetical protein